MALLEMFCSLLKWEVLDKESMFKVKSYRKEKARVLEHEVKPLQLIWSLLPQYNHTNTLHIDDLGRNFAMNPKNVRLTLLCLITHWPIRDLQGVRVEGMFSFHQQIVWSIPFLWSISILTPLCTVAFYLNEDSQKDTELFLLAKYLLKIAGLNDVTSVTHDVRTLRSRIAVAERTILIIIVRNGSILSIRETSNVRCKPLNSGSFFETVCSTPPMSPLTDYSL